MTAITSTARTLLDPSRRALLTAAAQETAEARYEAAYQAALVTGIVFLDIRKPGHGRDALEIWDALRTVAPELGEWPDFFESTRLPLSGGMRAKADVTARDAHDLLRDAEAFYHLIEKDLALPYRQVLPGELPDVR